MDLKEVLHQYNVLYQTGKLNPNATRTVANNLFLDQMVKQYTSFLPETTTLRERLYCIVNNITTLQLCPVCGTQLKIKSTGKLEYFSYCSRECAYQSKQRTENKKQTMLQRHGVEYTGQSEELRKKMQQTCTQRYGVENVFQDNEMQQTIRKQNRKRYGVENVMFVPEVKEKHRQSLLKVRYEHRGIPQKLNDRSWLVQQHHKNKKSLQQIAEELGLKDRTSISRKLVGFDIEIQRFFQSTGEREIFTFLTEELHLNVIQQDRKILEGQEIDMYIPEYQLGIEYCGIFWHSEQQSKNKNYHKNKQQKCQQQGILLLTIFEDEWKQRQLQVKNKIRSLVNKDDRKKINARQTDIIIVNGNIKASFFEQNHIQGDGPSSINIGLTYKDQLVAVMGFIQQKDLFYLNRYATSQRVIGGFSKLLKYFQTHYQWKEIVSFADLRWSDGNLYKKTGWKLDKVIPPDYYYSFDGRTRYHKFNFRRKNLSRLLENFDPNLSEKQNCDNNGVLRIWDCGKQRWVISNK